MAENQPATERQITGEDLISELIRNMELGRFKIRYTTLLPCIFRIYLHAEDYELLRPVLPYLATEARRAAEERLEELNQAAQPSALARRLGVPSGPPMEFKILEDWTIEFHADHEDKLQRGDIEIYSELGSAPRQEYGAGSLTRRITRRSSQGKTSTEVLPAASQVSSALSGTAANELAGEEVAGQDMAAEEVFAWLRYKDKGGAQRYAMTKNQVVIGRGGKSFWVDVKLETEPDVSREHCRLRRDPGNGKFYLKDVSQFGTSVDGKRIPSSLEKAGGEERDKNVEVPLPRRCIIGLADTLSIEFEVA
ncbi:MAG: FHA domain-containing protein [Bryobacteraceae bacterium]